MNTQFTNRFLSLAWPDAVDLIGNEIIHSAHNEAEAQGYDLHVSETSMEMNAAPQARSTTSGLEVLFPGTGRYVLRTRVDKHILGIGTPDVHISVYLNALSTVGRDSSSTTVTVDVQTDTLGDIFSWFSGFRGEIKKKIEEGFNKYLGFFNTMCANEAKIPVIKEPALVYGFSELTPESAIDIVLVSDGFSAGNIGEFNNVVNAFVQKIKDPSGSHSNEPYFSFKTAIRIWKVELLAANPGEAAQRAVTQYYDQPSSSYKTALSNLAILEAIGSKVLALQPEVFVFMSSRANLGNNPRAMALGNLVMLPVSGGNADHDARTLIHELGHTVLGHLADEYYENERPNDEYHGKEPAAPNVTIQAPNSTGTSPAKWAKWTRSPASRPAWDIQPISGFRGARYYGLGIYRPANSCRMHNSDDDIAFCAVCREAITRQLLSLGGRAAFLLEYSRVPQQAGMPWRKLVYEATAGVLIDRFRTPETGQAAFTVKVAAATLPEPWQVQYIFTGTGPCTVQGSVCTVTARFNDVLKINFASACPFVPFNPIAPKTIEVRFNLPLRTGPQAAPSVPSSLSTRRLGYVGVLGRIQLSASAEDPNADDIQFTFEISGGEDNFTRTARTSWLSWTQASPRVTGSLEQRLPEGQYRFRARATDNTNRNSAWSAWKDFVVVPRVEPDR